MKKLLIACGAALLSVAAVQETNAQVRVNLNVNIGSQPNWGPRGYNHVDYYYMPDIETYYYVPTRQFIYLSGGNWVFSYGLPPHYSGYDLYGGRKVVINRSNAYHYHNQYRSRYGGYKIDRRDGGYYKHDNGRKKGHWKKQKRDRRHW
jgi:hypothetical protein